MSYEVLRFEVIDGEDYRNYRNCVICGRRLDPNHKKCCSGECNGLRYEILSHMRSVMNNANIHIIWKTY